MTRLTLLALGLLTLLFSNAQTQAQAQDARKILDVAGVQGELIVVIGCDSPKLLAQLHAGKAYLVHGLDCDPEKVAAARSYLRDKDLYGSVTVARWDGCQLPYVDSLVKLIVLAGETRQVSENEIMRVLAPLGVIVDARKEPK